MNTQIKNQSIPPFVSSLPLAPISLGQPHLGTFWIIDFLTISFQSSAVTGGLKVEGKFRPVIKLLENETVIIAEVIGEVLSSGKEGEKLSTGAVMLGFNFPQAPNILAGQSISIEIRGGLIKGTGALELNEGSITMGYEIGRNAQR